MECPDENALVAMIEGELDPADRDALDAHLDSCAICASLVIELAHVLTPADPARDVVTPADAQRRIGGGYVLGALIGQGGMGAVYEGHHETLERRVAIKLLRADMADEQMRHVYTERLLREARLLASLSHPHIVTIYDVGVWREDQIFLAMELIQGDTLRGWLIQQPRTWHEILHVYLQAARGLEAAHERGIIHRDVKPENMLIGHDGRVRVSDFGLARARGVAVEEALAASHASSTPDHITRTGDIMGTPAYMAPEQHLGAEVDAPADQFALCVALWEALCGERPFAGSTRQALSMEVCAGRLQAAPQHVEAPRALLDVLRRGLQSSPAQRWGSMGELIDALEQAALPPAPRVPLGTRLLIAALALVSLAALGLLYREQTRALPVPAPPIAAQEVRPVEPVEPAPVPEPAPEPVALPIAPASQAIARAWSESLSLAEREVGTLVSARPANPAQRVSHKPRVASPAQPKPVIVAAAPLEPRSYAPRADAPRFDALLDAMADGRVTWLEEYMEVARRGFAEGNGSGCINALSLSFGMLETRDLDRTLLEGECLLLSGKCADGEQTLRAAYKMSTMSGAQAKEQAKSARAARCNEGGPPGAFRNGVPTDPRRGKRLLENLRDAEGVVDGVQLFP
jgi:serine/threonine protein kinase